MGEQLGQEGPLRDLGDDERDRIYSEELSKLGERRRAKEEWRIRRSARLAVLFAEWKQTRESWNRKHPSLGEFVEKMAWVVGLFVLSIPFIAAAGLVWALVHPPDH